MEVELFRCTFEPRFRDESSMHLSDLESPPFKTITGAGIKETEPVSPDPVRSPAEDTSTQPGTSGDEPEAPTAAPPGVAGDKPKDTDEKDTDGTADETGFGSDESDDDEGGKKGGHESVSSTKQPGTADEAGSSPDSSPETVDISPSGEPDSDTDKPKGKEGDDKSDKPEDAPETPEDQKKPESDKESEGEKDSPDDEDKSPPLGRTPDDTPADDDDESSKPGDKTDAESEDFDVDLDDMFSEEPAAGPGEPQDAMASESSIGPEEDPGDHGDDDEEEDIIDSPDPTHGGGGDDDEEEDTVDSPDPTRGGDGDDEPVTDPTDATDDEQFADPSDSTHGGSEGYSLYFSPFRECNQVCAQAGDSYKVPPSCPDCVMINSSLPSRSVQSHVEIVQVFQSLWNPVFYHQTSPNDSSSSVRTMSVDLITTLYYRTGQLAPRVARKLTKLVSNH